MKKPNLSLLLCIHLTIFVTASFAADQSAEIAAIFNRVEAHDFNPTPGGFTKDRDLNTAGVASLDDLDWKVRTLAIRDLVKAGNDAVPAIKESLKNENQHVRYLAAMALGILRAEDAVEDLERLLKTDSTVTVRSQAAVALGQIGKKSSLVSLNDFVANNKNRDVLHQAELAIHAIEHDMNATPELATAYSSLDAKNFATAKVGELAPDFALPDTDGKSWKISDFRGKKSVLLIWIFADWCPVCHGEFRELMKLRDDFEAAGIQPFTLECHDLLPARVMVGKELEPKYWFSKKSFQESYVKNVWWPHLVDRAAAVGVQYNVQPMTFAVHSEYINRPTVAIIDKEGVLRFLYQGTFWGDRPSIHQVLKMAKSGNFEFDAPKRLQIPAKP